METKNNTILITGGATGIGFSLAETLVSAGNKVIICGRREGKLKEAKDKLPQIQAKVCDVSREKERESLFNWVKDNFRDLNVLINNAGIQRMVNLKKGTQDLFSHENEVETNLIAPIHLSAYFIPLLLKKKESAIINVSSGLGFVPIASMPVYCATKAAIHSFTVSLRYQLRDTSIKVFEIVPPAVDTELGKGTTEEGDQEYRGISPSEVDKAALTAMANNEYDIVVGEAKGLVMGARTNPELTFQNMNRW
ncbi:MAG: SDR family NAD(P)-dependent oxidoreductase [Chloroflexi bacterium]|nr:SDR family NAD(P)-dependent oxidoreductase [Chloroflexota bacterium]